MHVFYKRGIQHPVQVCHSSLCAVWLQFFQAKYTLEITSALAAQQTHCGIGSQVHWGQHSLVEAARLLLAALRDSSNVRFQLLAGQTIPLFPPAVVYQQLMQQNRSHIRACTPPTPVRHMIPWLDLLLTKHHWFVCKALLEWIISISFCCGVRERQRLLR